MNDDLQSLEEGLARMVAAFRKSASLHNNSKDGPLIDFAFEREPPGPRCSKAEPGFDRPGASRVRRAFLAYTNALADYVFDNLTDPLPMKLSLPRRRVEVIRSDLLT